MPERIGTGEPSRGEHCEGCMVCAPGEEKSEPIVEHAILSCDLMPDAVLIVNHKGKIEHANHMAERLFRYSRVELEQMSIEELVPENERERHAALRGAYMGRPRHRGMAEALQVSARRKDGELVSVEISLAPFKAATHEFIVASVRDVSARRTREAQLLFENTHDALTGLYNRSYVETVRAKLDAEGHTHGVIVLDLDGLKAVNDREGHQGGDRLLRRTALVLRSVFGSDGLTARLGGDEFVVLLPNIDEAQLSVSVVALRVGIAQHNELTHGPPLQLSIGAALTMSRGGTSLAMSLADKRMYHEKRSKYLPGAQRATTGTRSSIPPSAPSPSSPPSERSARAIDATGHLVAVPDFHLGDRVAGNFKIRGRLGTERLGVLYEADDMTLGRRVVLKVPRSGDDPERLRHEAHVLAVVHHPSFLDIHGLVRHDGIDVLVLERIFGISLEKHLSQRASTGVPFEIDETVHVLLGIASGLQALHHAGFSLSELHPVDVVLGPESRVVLMDIGHAPVAKAHAPQEALHALGVIALQMLGGNLLLEGSVLDFLLAHESGASSSDMALLRSDTPAALLELVLGLLARPPRPRLTDVDLVVARLRAIADHRPTKNPRGSRELLIVEEDADLTGVIGDISRRILPDAEITTVSTGEAALSKITEHMPSLLVLDLHLPGVNGVEVATYLRGMYTSYACTIIALCGANDERDRTLLRALGITHLVRKGNDFSKDLSYVLSSLLEREPSPTPAPNPVDSWESKSSAHLLLLLEILRARRDEHHE